MMRVVAELGEQVGVAAACAALKVPRASLYRNRRAGIGAEKQRVKPVRRLSEVERDTVHQLLVRQPGAYHENRLPGRHVRDERI